MEKRQKDILRPLVAELRRTLAGTGDGSRRGDLDRTLERLGIAVDGAITPFDAVPNPTPAERRARQVAEAELSAVGPKERPAARAAFVERAAYGWVNRLLALRVLEARGLIEETLRGNPAYDGLSEALYVLRQSNPAHASGPDGGWWAVIEDACSTQAAALPGLFALDTPRAGSSSTLHDPAIALRPGATALAHCIELLGAPSSTTRAPKATASATTGRSVTRQPRYPAVVTAGSPTVATAALAEMDAAFADPDAIGWAYQFYQEEAKAGVYARLKAGKKVTTRDDIAAATQLFTEPYMVQWLLQNSLGRSYHEAYPHSALPATWPYYIRPDTLDTPAFPTLEGLTVLDPCMGSGHFLREAFDMLMAMYREQQPDLAATEVADRILDRHLHGIDIDPRAAQLAAFTLYARAWELVRGEHRAQRRPGSGIYIPQAMNLATSPDDIATGALQRHLGRHPEDHMLEPLLKGVFAALEQADILGSLLRPREHLQAAIAALRKPHMLRLGSEEEQQLQAAIETVAHSDPAHLEDMLLDRVAASFAAEARNTGDVAASLFGRAAERGVRLLQLLDRQYAVVVTNPPYMGSKNMDAPMRLYVEHHYTAGKRDLYAAFILRCTELAHSGARTAMITQQGWMFLSSYSELRSTPKEQLPEALKKKVGFTGLLRQTSIDTLAHLGPNAFSDISGEVVQSTMFIFSKRVSDNHSIIALRLTGIKGDKDKAVALKQAASQMKLPHIVVTRIRQDRFTDVPNSPLVYWVSDKMIDLLNSQSRFGQYASARGGMSTGSNKRHTRFMWEVSFGSTVGRWVPYAKSDGYRRWYGLEHTIVDWREKGIAIRKEKGSVVPSQDLYFTQGISYGLLSQGSIGARETNLSIFDNGCIFVHPYKVDLWTLVSIMNSHLFSYFLRIMTQSIRFNAGYAELVPMPENRKDDRSWTTLSILGQRCVTLMKLRTACDLTEATFTESLLLSNLAMSADVHLHSCEAVIEQIVNNDYGIGAGEVKRLMDETGLPSGWHPLVVGYDSLPELNIDRADQAMLPEVLAYLTSHQRLRMNERELAQLQQSLRRLYEGGPGANAAAQDETEPEANEPEEDSIVSEKCIPFPTETFLEELSQKLGIHPISVYWLLQEIRAEGARCKPEEQRLLADRLTVFVLRLLGHCWPKQIEAGEPVPAWADDDGIIPLLPGAGETPLADRVRERLRAEDGDLGVQQTEALLTELTGQDLETWLRRSFYPRHVRQFKYRPIAWHLASAPVVGAGSAKGKGGKGRGGSRQAPAFECLVYYHACGLGLLARLRTQYVEPLLRAERGRVDAARQAGDDTAAAQATARVQELADFVERLREVEEQGFDSPGLEGALADEPLDRWSGDGIVGPMSRDALLAGESAWAVDINDGVRVNVAPLQLAGVLAADVLKEVDARKAIADRVRWRADERRWVREGVLPRCGWMGDDVPESPRWTERAPEREAEQRKLERKRAEAMARLGAPAVSTAGY